MRDGILLKRKKSGTKKYRDEKVRWRIFLQTKQCVYENMRNEKMRDGKKRDERMRDENMRDEKMRTKKCPTKKCLTKICPVTPKKGH